MDEITLPGQPPTIELIHQLHEAVYGYSCARPESPMEVWEELLEQIRLNRSLLTSIVLGRRGRWT